MRTVPAILILAALVAACGTAGTTGSARLDGSVAASHPAQVNVPNAASNVSDMPGRQHGSAPRAVTPAAAPPVIAQAVPPPAVVVLPAGQLACSSNSGSGKARPMCAPE